MSSTVIAKNVQIGADGTASNNFTIFQPATPDGTLRIGNGNTGITSSAVALTSAGKFLLGTSSVVASSSATLQVAGSGTTASVTLARTDLPGSGNSFCGIDAYAFDGTASVVGGTINFRAAENWSSTNHGTDMQFRVTASGSGGALTETVRFTSAGNVGIGTSSPATKVHALTPSATAVGFRAGNSVSYAEFQVDASGNSQLIAPGGTQIFNTNSSERMRIDSSGNVGIGTSSPVNLLTVQTAATGTTAGSNVIARLQSNASGRDATLQFSDNVANSATISMVSGAVAVAQNGVERTRIDTSGNFQFNSGYGSVATAYGCRAWVNFNGQGTVAIRSSGNISSITDLGTGSYQVNISTAMPDINYSIVATTGSNGGAWVTTQLNCNGYSVIAPTTSTFRVQTPEGNFASMQDPPYVNVAIFR